MSRPVIGLCAALEQARWSAWDMEAVLLPHNYLQAVRRAGGLAILIAPDEHSTEHPDELLDLIDGLLLAGGSDIDPASYGAEADPQTTGFVPVRDAFEIALTRHALERGIPVLGICRGMQLINVARGGTLIQDVPAVYGHQNHRRALGSFEGADHDVRLAEGSLAARAAGEAQHSVKSHHHQGIDVVGEGLTVTGWSQLDELPEAIEDEGAAFALGVQWHPEADERSELIGALVEKAASHASE